MWTWIKELDRVLRGAATRMGALKEGTIRVPVVGLTAMIVLLGVLAGFCVGWYALFNREPPAYEQVLATMVKVPLLFFLTLVVTFPSLYVFNALVGSRLSIASVFRLLIAAIAVTVAVLASFGPITAFFSVSTENYSFMVLLNVLLFGVAGLLGLVFLLQTLHRLSLVAKIEERAAPPPGEAQNSDPGSGSARGKEGDVSLTPNDESLGALEHIRGYVLGAHVKTVFRCWVVVFALVGGQMAWVLRPFIGDPARPFTWLRPRDSNFFEAVWNTILTLFR